MTLVETPLRAIEKRVIQKNLETINDAIRSICPARRVRLVAVSKEVSVAHVIAAASLGVTCFGENRVRDGIAKKQEFLKLCSPPEILKARVEWHMIGHLQSKKARAVVENFDLIHSLDSVKLARRIDGICEELGKRQKVLIQVNVSGEETKYGVRPEKLPEVVRLIRESCRNVEITGLMGMAPFCKNSELAGPVFSRLKGMADELGLLELSMGMTNDWRVALCEGATLLRIGRGVFQDLDDV